MIVNQEQPTKLNEPPTNIQCYSKMKCANRYCYYNNEFAWEMDKSKILSVKCPFCSTTVYHSEACLKDDEASHKKVCVSQSQATINRPYSSSKNNNLNDTSIILNMKGIQDFEKVQGQRELGRGSYGFVCLVKERITGELFAMKVMNKKFIFQYSSAQNLKNEIKIQRKLKHPHIARLYYYFEDDENVYLILEYAPNGNLFHFLRSKKKLSETDSFIYFFQTCLGINYIQKKGIIHRDLKPENLLLDAKFNIKLCDFGWSAQANHRSRTTFCGTIEYMAPEMLMNLPYRKELDNWCLGVLLFELLHGYPPFGGKSENDKIRSIKEGKIRPFSREISKDAEDLVRGLLKTNPNERYSMDLIFSHPWMNLFYKEFKIDIKRFLKEESPELYSKPILIQEETRSTSESKPPLQSSCICNQANPEFKKRLEGLKSFKPQKSEQVREKKNIKSNSKALNYKKNDSYEGFWESLLMTLGCTDN